MLCQAWCVRFRNEYRTVDRLVQFDGTIKSRGIGSTSSSLHRKRWRCVRTGWRLRTKIMIDVGSCCWKRADWIALSRILGIIELAMVYAGRLGFHCFSAWKGFSPDWEDRIEFAVSNSSTAGQCEIANEVPILLFFFLLSRCRRWMANRTELCNEAVGAPIPRGCASPTELVLRIQVLHGCKVVVRFLRMAELI